MTGEELYQIAFNTIKPIQLKKSGEAGHVACAIESAAGNIYTGICVDMPCSMGFCAEQAAVAEMLKNGETKIEKIIAVYEDGTILPPCGKCREFISQLDDGNMHTIVSVATGKDMPLGQLLPERWDEKRK